MSWLTDLIASLRNRARPSPFASGQLVNIDPRQPFSSESATLNCLGVSGAMRNAPELGVMGADGQLRFGKVADPLDPAKHAFLLRVKKGDPSSAADYPRQRVEYSDAYASRCTPLGQEQWQALALMVSSSWRAESGVVAYQMFESADDFDVPSNPSLGLVFDGTMRLVIRSNPNLASLGVAQNIVRTVFADPSFPTDVWQKFAFRLRLHWDASQDPYTQLFRQVGNGPIEQLVDDHQPNAYNNVQRAQYPKAGVYAYGDWPAGMTERLMHSKGLYTWAHRDGMDAAGAMAFLGAI